MFGQAQRQFRTDRVSCHYPKWVSCDGNDLATGDAFWLSRLQAASGFLWRGYAEFERAQKVEEKFHHDFDGIDFT